MLETLDQVDWLMLPDAYGPSTKTPRLIRNLASDNPRKRRKAVEKLCYTIYHQGTIYAAAVAAVPFLLEIVASSEVPDRTAALEVLQVLSTGRSYHAAHASSFFNREKSKTPEWEEKVREEKSWVAAIRERLDAAVPAIARVLREGKREERIAAASVLATLPDNSAAMEALLAAVADADPSVVAAALTAVGAQDNAPAEVLEKCFARATNELVRTVAAIQVICHREQNSPPAAVEHLLAQLRSPQAELRKAYEALPDVGTFLGDIGKALAVSPPASAREAFPLLYEQVKRSPFPLNPNENFGLLMLAVMLQAPIDRKWTAAALTREQRQAIRLLADRAWTIDRSTRSMNLNLVELLEGVGLPGNRDDTFGLLAGTPEGEQTPEEVKAWSQTARRPWWKFFLYS